MPRSRQQQRVYAAFASLLDQGIERWCNAAWNICSAHGLTGADLSRVANLLWGYRVG